MQPEKGLTLEDVAILVDGTGNIPDDTAERLAPVIATDPRVTAQIGELRHMAEEAGSDYLADALDAHTRFSRLQEGAWRHPTDILEPNLDVPYRELISIATLRAERARSAERAELLALKERLEIAYVEDLLAAACFRQLAERLLEVQAEVAIAALGRLAAHLEQRLSGPVARGRRSHGHG